MIKALIELIWPGCFVERKTVGERKRMGYEDIPEV